MTTYRFLILSASTITCFLSLINACKDMGSELPPKPFITGVTPDSGVVGDQIKVNGGNFGDSQGSSSVLFGSVSAMQYDEWQSDEIKVRVPANALTGLVRVRTDGGESNGILFRVILPPGAFGVVQKNIALNVGDSLVQTISGGTQPYVFVSKGDTTKAAVSISGTSLTVRGIAAGSSTVIIGESSVPQLLDTVNVTVSAPAPISYAGQVQPIFTSNCLSGCHTPGGIGPFSLLEGESYGTIVNMPATVSPTCPGVVYRVRPFSADSSVLYRRISGTSCGVQMPYFRPPLLTADQNLIRDWINQGAQNN
jgi:hypothetical protein